MKKYYFQLSEVQQLFLVFAHVISSHVFKHKKNMFAWQHSISAGSVGTPFDDLLLFIFAQNKKFLTSQIVQEVLVRHHRWHYTGIMAADKAVTHNLFTYHNKQTKQQYFNRLFIHSDGFFTFSYAWTWGTGWWHHVLDLLYHNPEELQQNEKGCPLSLFLYFSMGIYLKQKL